MKDHEYKTKINMVLAEKRKSYFKRQINKLIKEKKEFDAGFGFNPNCKCEKCQLRNKIKVVNV